MAAHNAKPQTRNLVCHFCAIHWHVETPNKMLMQAVEGDFAAIHGFNLMTHARAGQPGRTAQYMRGYDPSMVTVVTE